jgi:hypothetical protein
MFHVKRSVISFPLRWRWLYPACQCSGAVVASHQRSSRTTQRSSRTMRVVASHHPPPGEGLGAGAVHAQIPVPSQAALSPAALRLPAESPPPAGGARAGCSPGPNCRRTPQLATGERPERTCNPFPGPDLSSEATTPDRQANPARATRSAVANCRPTPQHPTGEPTSSTLNPFPRPKRLPHTATSDQRTNPDCTVLVPRSKTVDLGNNSRPASPVVPAAARTPHPPLRRYRVETAARASGSRACSPRERTQTVHRAQPVIPHRNTRPASQSRAHATLSPGPNGCRTPQLATGERRGRRTTLGHTAACAPVANGCPGRQFAPGKGLGSDAGPTFLAP